MDKIKDLLFAVMAVSLSAGIIAVLSPEGRGGGIKKQIGFAVAVAVFALIVSRTVGLFGEDFDVTLDENTAFPSQNAEAADEIITRAAALICEELEYAVSERFGISSPELFLVIDDSDTSEIKIVSAALSGEGELSEAAEYISGILFCEVTVK